MPDASEERRKKGRRAGMVMIVLGIVAPLINYFADMHSFDIGRMLGAGTVAVLEAIIFIGAGLLVIAYYTWSPDEDDEPYIGEDPRGWGDRRD